MKNRLFILSLVLTLFSLLAVQSNAMGTDPGLTRGVEILYEQDRLRKTGAPGESIAFSHLDFLPCCGEREMKGVIINTLPSAAQGKLIIGEEAIEAGSFIPPELLEKLVYIPNEKSDSQATFQFSFEENGPRRNCDLCYGAYPEENALVETVGGDAAVSRRGANTLFEKNYIKR